ncbi:MULTISPECIES: hypothetical protein [Acidiphilium]|uniref:Uncharacterized protein n=2 Tax=Acidiphilium TaxID=522 RepID=A5G1E6_ACICJ|nr:MULTISPECIES: hypothetical protein [Acidiphilium]MBU6357599.1 hypothetical protein [Rhodospirillales bacterium]ABQ31678.1 hypothetical protein Acry_2486 [Acidiphilium cryptum JF-5]KDM66551.1 hypothetical protein ACIDI_59c00270 [Acidiphilium sp. JA12-A1]MBS3022954.1 hypothetical protein [Acidiphilium multivorum]MDE2328366.1 hypothetical protein [Rhodospirillales bacterium]
MSVRALLVAGAFALSLPGPMIKPASRLPPIPVVSHRRETTFLTETTPLLDMEWWAVVAVRCHLRSVRWQSLVEEQIAYDAADAARTLWPEDSGRQGTELSMFTDTQIVTRLKAASAPDTQCAALITTSRLDELDRMAKAAGW